MKILVGLKKTIDYAATIRVKPDLSGVVKQGVKMSMNPFDEIALEEAVKLKEKQVAQEVIGVSIGPKSNEEILRNALAKGADRVILIESQEDVELEPLAVAKILSKMVEKESPKLVLLGKQAIDDDSCQTGQILSALLKWPQATFASEVKVEQETVQVTREVDGGLETLEMKVPAVITADLRLNTPRYATLPNIMKARKKPIETLSLKDLGIDVTPRIKVLQVNEPEKRKGGVKVNTVEELFDKLKNEKKVI